MTVISRARDFSAPLRARLGLLLPGLGHLVLGETIVGLGLLSLDVLLLGSLFAGLPRLGGVLFSGPAGSLSWHGVLSIFSWIGLAGCLWWVAYRRAWPRVLTEIEFNSNRQIFLRTLSRHKTGMIGLFGVAFLVSMTLLTPLIAPFDPLDVDVGPQNMGPSWLHPMGTDQFGRDVFSRLLYGGRISLPIGFVAVFIAATVGTTLGATAAFLGGVVDKAIMFVVDALLALPRLVLLLTIVGLFRVPGVWGIFLIVVILGFTAWMGIARIVRGEVLSLKEQEFIQAARALGLSSQRILFRHLIPNAMAPVIVFCSLAIGSTMLAEAGLSFLGLGVPPPTSTWGVMVNDGRDPLRIAPWIAVFPGLAIMIAVLSFNLLGDGLRDATDPKLRGTG
ncbi:MAG TPA: ABC transporter permease [Deltaproteobacteria bacterium]|nr:ABC transporter permease [Deltaproteobacteria bacterium]